MLHVPIRLYKKTEHDDGTMTVYGKAAGDNLDLDDQILDKDFLEKSMREWFDEWGNIRQQHSTNLPPAGKAMKMDIKHDGIYVEGHIVEPTACRLLKAGVYQAYSIGIAKPRLIRDIKAKGGRVVGGITSEISLVDYPSNPTCRLSIAKRLGGSIVDDNTMWLSDLEVPVDQREELVKSAMVLLTKMQGTMTKREFDSGVGGGVDRDTLPVSDFADKENRKYPIVNPGDVSDAWGLAGHAENPDKVRRRIKAIAQRKGPEFVSELPETASVEKGAKNKTPGKKPAPLPAEPGDASVSSSTGSPAVMKGDAPFLGAAPPIGGDKPKTKKPKGNPFADGGPKEDDTESKVDPDMEKKDKVKVTLKTPPADEDGSPESDEKDNVCDECGKSPCECDDTKAVEPEAKKAKGKKIKPAARALPGGLSDAGKDGAVMKGTKKQRQLIKGLMATLAKSDSVPFYVRRYHDAMCPTVTNKTFNKTYGADRIEILTDQDNAMLGALAKSVQNAKDQSAGGAVLTSLMDAYGCAKTIAALQPQLLKGLLAGWSGNEGSSASAGISSAENAKDSVTAARFGRDGNVAGQERRSPAGGSGDSGARMPQSGNTVSPEQFGRMDYVSGQERRSPGDRVTKVYGNDTSGNAGSVYENAAANQAASAVQQLHDHLSWTWPDMCPGGHSAQPATTGNRGTGKIGNSRLDMKDASVPTPVPTARGNALESAAGVPGRLNKAFGATDDSVGAPILRKVAKLEKAAKRAKKINKGLKAKLTKMAKMPDTAKAPVRGAVWDPIAILKGVQPKVVEKSASKNDDLREYLTNLAASGDAAHSAQAQEALDNLND